jgi:hypothetical protein
MAAIWCQCVMANSPRRCAAPCGEVAGTKEGVTRMTSRERLLTAMRLGQPDRLPINIRGVPAWDEGWCASRHPSYRPVIEAVAAHGDYYLFWSPPAGHFLSMTGAATDAERVEHPDWTETIVTMHTPRGDLRSRYLSSKRGLPGMQREFWVKTLEDVERVLSVPYMPLGSVDASGFVASEARVGDRGLTLVDLGNDPIGHIQNLMGSELLAIWSIEERATILRLVEVFQQRLLDRLAALLGAGVGRVFCLLGKE